MRVLGDVELHVCPDDHKHAVNTTCYTAHKCRCAPCRQGNTDRMALARRQQAYGRYERRRADPLPVIAHIRYLQGFGYSYERIAAVAGVSGRTIYRLNTVQLRFVFARVAHAILAVTPSIDDLADGHLIPSRGAVRRIQALATRGWSIAAVAREMGWNRTGLSHVLHRPELQLRTHRRIAEVYERLWNAEPPAEGPWDRRSIDRTIAHATAAGWLPPLAWDDIDNDVQPSAGDEGVVDEIAIDLAVHGHRVHLTREERHMALRTLHARGYNDIELAELLLVSDQTIGRDRKYLELPANLGAAAERLVA